MSYGPSTTYLYSRDATGMFSQHSTDRAKDVRGPYYKTMSLPFSRQIVNRADVINNSPTAHMKPRAQSQAMCSEGEMEKKCPQVQLQVCSTVQLFVIYPTSRTREMSSPVVQHNQNIRA